MPVTCCSDAVTVSGSAYRMVAKTGASKVRPRTLASSWAWQPAIEPGRRPGKSGQSGVEDYGLGQPGAGPGPGNRHAWLEGEHA